jgi:hypothetical protein
MAFYFCMVAIVCIIAEYPSLALCCIVAACAAA